MQPFYEYQDTVLGMIICNPARYWPIAKSVGFYPEAFVEVERMKIAEAILHLANKESPITFQTITEYLRGDCAGMIDRCVSNSPLEQSLEWYLSQINNWHVLNNLVLPMNALCQEIMSATFSDYVEPVIAKLEAIKETAKSIQASKQSGFDYKKILESMVEIVNKKISKMALDGKDGGYKTGIKKLDLATNGFMGGRFYIIAARTSVGKTTFAAHACLMAMKQGAKAVFFSNEMDKEDLAEKMLSNTSKISGTKIQHGKLSQDEYSRFLDNVSQHAKLNLYVDEKSGWDLDALINVVHQQHRNGKCDIVFVDYLQQVRVRGATQSYERVSKVSDAMKKLSRDLNIPVIGLAQINREAEKNNNSDMPRLSNLKDSGSLEQDADVVLILHKKHIADPEMELFVAKNRYGVTGTFPMTHLAEISSYAENRG